MDAGLLLLRVVAGLTVAAHGAQKLFGWFDGPGPHGFAEFLESLGFRRGRALSWAGGLAEFGGGLFLALGLLTPLAAAAIIGVMVTAAVVVHAQNGFFNAEGGFELPALLAAVATSVALAGPGVYALDSVLEWELATTGWAFAGILLGLAAAAVVVGLQRLQSRVSSRRGPRTA